MKIFDKLQEGKEYTEGQNGKKSKRRYQYWSYQRIYIRLLLVILTFSVIPCVLIGLWANYYIKNVVLDHYMEEYLNSIYQNVSDGMNHYIDQVSAYAVYIFSDGKIYSIADDPNLSEQEKTKEIQDYLNRNQSSIAENVDIVIRPDFVIRKKEETISMSKENYQVPLRHTNIIILKELAENDRGEKYIVFGRSVYNLDREKKEFDLYIYVPESKIYQAIEEINHDNNLLYLTVDDLVMSHPDKQKLGRYVLFPDQSVAGKGLTKRRMGDFFYDYRPLSLKIATQGQWVIESRMDYQMLYQATEKMQRETVRMILFAVAAALLIAVLVPVSLLRSISSLKRRMQDFVMNRTEHNGSKCSYAEIHELEESFNQMVVEINDLMERNVMEKEKQRRAELQALQAQINPHFIYNALDSIAWYAKIEKQSYIADMVYELANFFRISLHKGDNIIRLSDEISHVESYIAIEQMRFPDMFEVEYKIQEDLLEEKIIKIILQPIVENCIKHGFENVDSGGKINITAYDTDRDIIFEVEDNGNGMGVDPLSRERESSVGYGIKNVNERIKLEYGEQYGLSFHSVPGEGTLVRIRIGKIK